MPFSDIALVLRWIVPLWALGWLVFPLSSRLFAFLPDRGLAAGRVVALVLVSLLAFWGGSLHVLPLSLSAYLLVVLPLVVGMQWKNPALRATVRANRRALLWSDLVFLGAFALFLWIRLRHPDAGDLEKPMDMALLSSSARAIWLPFQNPWFSGIPFTNYYYFGPLMGGLLTRVLATPPYQAYNLVQPLFCTLFLSVLWSVGAALSKSIKAGFLVMLLVGMGGHFEPLRQMAQTKKFWPLDWWTTSRVIENTINEYPAFTQIIGDLHAHFYAFSLAVTHFCICLGILKTESARARNALLVLGGLFLGVFALTNTWDTPLYGLLWLGCALWSRKKHLWTPANTFTLLASLLLVPVVAAPYFLKFHSQVSGVKFDPWSPSPYSFAMLWGGWWMLGFAAFGFPSGEEELSDEAIFRHLLIGVGLIALLCPFVFYIRGVFGDGDYRHQDTVFKFGLQAWLLLGTGIATETLFRVKMWWKGAKVAPKFMAGAAAAVFIGILSLAPICVIWARAVRDAPRDENGHFILSLNAARFLGGDDLAGIEWLRKNARPDETIIEVASDKAQGGMSGDYDPNYGRIAAFSGVPCLLAWPQHIGGWGAPGNDMNDRSVWISNIYHWPNNAVGTEALQKSGATYIFLGSQENTVYGRGLGLKKENDYLATVRNWNDLATSPPQIMRFNRSQIP